ncbi:hypothetical protein HD806DRAFT_527618 [Xylariaceae sp. AK1471]|nr:hypothetical protein HD806DRAFT_527618 [Xylariaceae sp. AK1471]
MSMAEAYQILGYKTHHALDEPLGSPWAEDRYLNGHSVPVRSTTDPGVPVSQGRGFTARLRYMWPSFKSEIVDLMFPPMASVLFFLPRLIMGYHATDAMRKILFGMFRTTNKKRIGDHARKTYEEYYRQVHVPVPAERRLKYEIGSGWEPLCDFLGKEIPDVPFPPVNYRESHTAYLKAWRARTINNIIRKMCIPLKG